MGEKVTWVEIHPPEYVADVLRAIERGEDAKEQPAPEGTIRVPMVSATRVKAYDRNDARIELRKWILREMGVDPESEEADERVDLADLPDRLQREWVTLFQATDIIGAMADLPCENWEPPAELAGWLEVMDYIYTPLLDKAWVLNPHWRLEATPLSKNGPEPGSQSSKGDSTKASEPG